MTQGAIPSVIRFQRRKAPRSSERRDPSRDRNRNEGLGRRCGRVEAREWASIPSRTHRRRQEAFERANEEGPRSASSEGSHAPARTRTFAFAQLFRPARFPCPGAHLKGVAPGAKSLTALRGFALEAECRGITRSSLRRIELEPSLQQKEEGAGSVKSASCVATFVGQPPAASEDDARGVVLVCRTLKTRCRSRKAATGPEKRPHR